MVVLQAWFQDICGATGFEARSNLLKQTPSIRKGYLHGGCIGPGCLNDVDINVLGERKVTVTLLASGSSRLVMSMFALVLSNGTGEYAAFKDGLLYAGRNRRARNLL